MVSERIFGGPTDHVTMHNTSSARAAAEQLLDLGRSRIALVGALEFSEDAASSASLRESGYGEALAAAGIGPDPDLVARSVSWGLDTGAEAICRLCRRGVDLDAVFALSDFLALGALRQLAVEGLCVPEGVAVIGFDNIDERRFSLRSLTTVDPGRDAIAETARQLLVERIGEKGEPAAPRTVKAGFRIVRRESTGFRDDDGGVGAG
nr:substrate-binding domain-containing protein [Arthrobacter gengyunqii]